MGDNREYFYTRLYGPPPPVGQGQGRIKGVKGAKGSEGNKGEQREQRGAKGVKAFLY